jgi:hypothetical protein
LSLDLGRVQFVQKHELGLPQELRWHLQSKVVITPTLAQNYTAYVLVAPDIAILCTVNDGSRHRDASDDAGCCVMTEIR